AAWALGNIGPDASAALPDLQRLVEELSTMDHGPGFAESDAGMFEKAAQEAILQIKGLKPRVQMVPWSKVSIPSLLDALQQSDPLREAAANDELVRRGAEAVPELLRVLSGAGVEVRARIVCVLREMGARAAAAIPALVSGLADREIYSSE